MYETSHHVNFLGAFRKTFSDVQLCITVVERAAVFFKYYPCELDGLGILRLSSTSLQNEMLVDNSQNIKNDMTITFSAEAI